MKKIMLLFVANFLIVMGIMYAQQGSESNNKNIFEALETPGLNSQSSVKIFQDKRIEQLVVAKRGENTREQATASGFRVQVFSSNVQRTAKGEAFKIEKMLKEEFPELGVYVNYASPFWKVRVGDFRTQAQAMTFRKQLIDAFPTMKSEAYIVREQIITSGSK